MGTMMKPQTPAVIWLSVAVLLATLTAVPLYASILKHLNLQQLCAQAGTVFSGVCISVDRSDSAVVSYTFAVHQMLKGTPAATITVRMHASAAALARAPSFHIGQEVVLFLYPTSEHGFTSPVGFGQGCFQISRTSDGYRTVVNERMNKGLLTGMSLRRDPQHNNSSFITALAASANGGPIDYDEFLQLVKTVVAETQ